MKLKTPLYIVSASMALSLCISQAQDDEKKPGPPPRPEEDGQRPRGGRPGGGGPGGPPAPDLKEADADKDGSISKQEWTDFMVKMAKERAERSFEFLDKDKSGDISKEELAAMRGRGPGGPGGQGRGPGGPGGERPNGPRPQADSDAAQKRPELEQ